MKVDGVDVVKICVALFALAAEMVALARLVDAHGTGLVDLECAAELLVGDRRDDRPQDLGLAVGGVVPVV